MKNKIISPRKRRHIRIRKKLSGTKARPRLLVYRSLKHLSAQLIDDQEGKTVLSLSTYDKGVRETFKYGGNVKAAEKFGALLAEKAKAKGITLVVFDRGGVQYHGRIRIFAEAARKAGLVF